MPNKASCQICNAPFWARCTCDEGKAGSLKEKPKDAKLATKEKQGNEAGHVTMPLMPALVDVPASGEGPNVVPDMPHAHDMAHKKNDLALLENQHGAASRSAGQDVDKNLEAPTKRGQAEDLALLENQHGAASRSAGQNVDKNLEAPTKRGHAETTLGENSSSSAYVAPRTNAMHPPWRSQSETGSDAVPEPLWKHAKQGWQPNTSWRASNNGWYSSPPWRRNSETTAQSSRACAQAHDDAATKGVCAHGCTRCNAAEGYVQTCSAQTHDNAATEGVSSHGRATGSYAQTCSHCCYCADACASSRPQSAAIATTHASND